MSAIMTAVMAPRKNPSKAGLSTIRMANMSPEPSKAAAIRPSPVLWSYFGGCGPFHVVVDEDEMSSNGSGSRDASVCTPEADSAGDYPASDESSYFLPPGILDAIDQDMPALCQPIGYEQPYSPGTSTKPPRLERGIKSETAIAAIWGVDLARVNSTVELPPISSWYSPPEDSLSTVMSDSDELRTPEIAPKLSRKINSSGLKGWARLHEKAPQALLMDRLHEFVIRDVNAQEYIIDYDDEPVSDADSEDSQ